MRPTKKLAVDHRDDSTPSGRHEGRDVLMTRSLEAALKAEPEADVPRIVDMLDETLGPADEYRCLNPACNNACPWPTEKSSGRPKLYCSKRCRQIHDRVRERLLREVELLVLATERNSVTKRQGEELHSAIARRQWALARYAPLRTGKKESDE